MPIGRITCPFLIHSTDDSNLGSIRSLAQRALHAMMGSHTVSIEDTAHERDQLPLTLCSNIIMYASMTKPQELHSENDKAAKYTISMYRNNRDCSPDHYGLSLERYFYNIFCRKTFMSKNNKTRFNNRMIVPQGLKCKPHHPVNYDYAHGMIIMHKPWNKSDTHKVLINNRTDTIQAFHGMVSNNEVPTSVVVQYILVVTCTDKRRIENVARGRITQDIINLDTMDNDEGQRFDA